MLRPSVLVFFCAWTSIGLAQTSTLPAAQLLKNKKFEEDKRITDIELRAQSGSLSRYSLKLDLSYSGPPVNNLSDPEMPNPDNRPRDNRTSLGGFMGVRYRVDSNSALYASTGLRWFAPYQEVTGQEVETRLGAKDYEFANPQLSYDRTYAAGPVQMRSLVKGSVTTQDFYKERGQQGGLGANQSFKYTVNRTRLILGLLMDTDVFLYNRGYERTDGRVANYNVAFIPSVEYRLTDSLNFRTSVAYSYANLRVLDDWTLWDPQNPSQRVGFGWAITRDIYVNPFLNFFLESPSIRTTSLSFSTVINIF